MSEHIDIQLPALKVRPRFQIETDLSVEELSARIRAALAAEGAACEGYIQHGFGSIYLPQREQEFWTPVLTLKIEDAENGSHFGGYYGPRPGVWFLFLLIYAVIAIAIFIVSIIGVSFMTIGQSGAILWLVPVLCAIFFSLYWVSYQGQKLSRHQLNKMHQFLEQATELEI